jgi:lipopolysaccharide/colanic/teichoic acid biosynthesis glycosyltransferase
MPDWKRMLDVAVAAAALAVTGPALVVLAAAVKLDSPGPALFVQTRVGRGGRPIHIPKLRTMIADAAHGPAVTAARDPRITRVGALLRRTKLDELPQLWSVLRGDMSIVGPRPEVELYVRQYRPEWRRLLDVRPGLTDLASLTFRDEEELLATANDRERAYVEVIMPMKLELAVRGVERQSVLQDLTVMARTALALVRSTPASEHPVLREVQRRIAELNMRAT